CQDRRTDTLSEQWTTNGKGGSNGSPLFNSRRSVQSSLLTFRAFVPVRVKETGVTGCCRRCGSRKHVCCTSRRRSLLDRSDYNVL
ncbi:hypothetical protein PENTCL1PPCAC_27790, partial [Pristionchus entomophagus]